MARPLMEGKINVMFDFSFIWSYMFSIDINYFIILKMYSCNWQLLFMSTFRLEMETFLFTFESMNEGHPDKLCD